ncbi:MAG: tRNA glutamyl-Q(34) synthetase GluQRS, partial [Muribaculaceae bacterium]|nr:tRNA glutamyl-Q(34) synthetase GluQRS [Muribaculaceae bacterium]
IEEDLLWLGLEWDEGGLENRGPNGPYMQSLRGDIYAEGLRRLSEAGLTYRCRCRRADILATQAPHESDGRVIYKGTCRPPRLGGTAEVPPEVPAATRLFVPDTTITFTDRCRGPQSVSLARHCGDFILRRADGAWAYQLAVVMDDALMGVTEVVRGEDLLLSAAQQIHLYELLGYPVPEFAHLPLVCNDRGERLSKRDNAMGMEALRSTHTPEELLGRVAALAGLLPSPIPVSLGELLSLSRER